MIQYLHKCIQYICYIYLLYMYMQLSVEGVRGGRGGWTWKLDLDGTPDSPATSCVTWGKSLHLSEPQCSHPCNGENKSSQVCCEARVNDEYQSNPLERVKYYNQVSFGYYYPQARVGQGHESEK